MAPCVVERVANSEQPMPMSTSVSLSTSSPTGRWVEVAHILRMVGREVHIAIQF